MRQFLLRLWKGNILIYKKLILQSKILSWKFSLINQAHPAAHVPFLLFFQLTPITDLEAAKILYEMRNLLFKRIFGS